jgi:sugar lactone lactonase YvrE
MCSNARGGEKLQSVDVGRGCFACVLGGLERSTLYIVAAEWLGFARLTEALGAEYGKFLAVQVAVGGGRMALIHPRTTANLPLTESDPSARPTTC